MSPIKKFLLQLLAAYLIIALPIAFMFGPPGFSGEFLETSQNELDHYFEVVKSNEYKRWSQRPHLVEADPAIYTEAFAADLAFVRDFEGSEAFRAEARRRAIFEFLFQVLNASTGVFLIVHFGRKPLMEFLEKQVALVRERIETAERARNEAKSARSAAEMQMGSLAAESEVLAEQAHAAAQDAVGMLDAETASLMESIEQELALRKKIEVQRAAMLLKAQLVEEAGKKVEEALIEGASDQRQRLLVAQFLEGLEGAAK